MQPVSCAGCQALQLRLRDLQAKNECLRRRLDEATRGGSVHTVLRAAARCEPVYECIRQSVVQSEWVVPDETGWRVGGCPAWLHVLAAGAFGAGPPQPNPTRHAGGPGLAAVTHHA